MPYAASDIVDFDTATSASPDVAASTALRHARGHSMTSTADHIDYGGETPTADQVLVYDTGDSKWHARSIVAVADGGRR